MDQYDVLEFITDKGDRIDVEIVSDNDSGFIKAGGDSRKEKKGTVKIEDAISQIGSIANGIAEAHEKMSMKPDTMEVQFKIALTGNFNVKLVSMSSTANMEVKLTWKG